MGDVRKAVIPAAGRGMRFLPASKAIPKELLPLVDKPALQYVVEEAAAAGLEQVCLITAQGKEPLRAHFEADASLEAELEAKGDARRLAAVREVTGGAQLTWVEQDAPRGLGHAVACAEDFAAGEPVAVLLGDDVVDATNPVLEAMIALREHVGGTVVLLLEVEERLASLYGVVESQPVTDPAVLADERLAGFEARTVTRLQEKPRPGQALSTLAVIGRYVLDPAAFAVLRDTPAGLGGEIQLTDALDTLARMPAAHGGGVHGIVFSGLRYDTGDTAEYLAAVVQVASRHPQWGEGFRAWLTQFVAQDLKQEAGR